ncbi:MAG: hypothetical protein AVDCRST_MAG19-1811, partial [uncultured Thermomicrobiales bacterium]
QTTNATLTMAAGWGGVAPWFRSMPRPSCSVKFVSEPGADQTYNTVVFIGNRPHVGTSAITVDYPGRYVLAVEAVGEWTVVVAQ